MKKKSSPTDWSLAPGYAQWIMDWAKSTGCSAMVVLTDGNIRHVMAEGGPVEIGEAIGKESCKSQPLSEVVIMAAESAMTETDTRTMEALEAAYCKRFDRERQI